MEKTMENLPEQREFAGEGRIRWRRENSLEKGEFAGEGTGRLATL